jgi:DNA-binding HxlR family transcriptional regulator
MREHLFDDVRRFADFQRRLGIARSTLAGRLEQLRSAGVMERNDSGHHVATESGADFLACLLAGSAWGDRWCWDGGTAPLQIVHSCGHAANPTIRCVACGEILVARGVRAERDRLPPAIDRLTPRQREPGYAVMERVQESSIARTLQVIGDRWSTLVIEECFFGTRRFSDFVRSLRIAPNILTARLNRLVALKVLERVPYDSAPQRFEYRLTARGLDLYAVPLCLMEWGMRWKPQRDEPVRLTHRPCGQPVHPLSCCGHCVATLRLEDLHFRYDPTIAAS